jgi:SecD/SecF fusion protein
MQLKGLVRFFAILLIIYSVYQLSFTWFVKKHERKMEDRALTYIKAVYPEAKKYAKAEDLPDSLEDAYNERLEALLDSTRDVTLTYGITGPVSYQKAKEEELNLGLDLQGGLNVTLEVEMTGLVRALANNSKDPNFLKALDNAERRKGNSEANFVTLFVEEYQALAGTGKLSALFFAANEDKIKIGDSDAKVSQVLNEEAKAAFASTFQVLNTRIDQFGVAQPTISPNPDRGIITVELPGIKDKDRVRDLLQSSANLQFWEAYPFEAVTQSFINADAEFDAFLKGTIDTAAADTTNKTVRRDTTNAIATTTKDSTLSGQLANNQADTTGKLPAADEKKRSLFEYIKMMQIQGTQTYIPKVAFSDTARVRKFLQSDRLRKHFPPDAAFAFEYNKKDRKNITLYVIKTYNSDKPLLDGAVTSARQDFDPTTTKPIVEMEMGVAAGRKWADITERSQKNNIPIAIMMDGRVYSAPVASTRIEGGRSIITGNFDVQAAQDLANILKLGKLSTPAKIVQDQEVGPTLGNKAIQGGLMAFLISFIVIFILMLVYYNTSGWVANIALILNLLFTVGVLTGLGATLTAPGIAGLVLTIGMAVDTNVVIYERIKEELTRGKGYIPAINDGYRRSLPPVLDGHITTLLTAIILFYFGLGPVKGFATTQILGLLLSLFCGILLSRWITDIFNKRRHLEYFTPISRKIFAHAKYKFIEYRKVAYGISVIVLLLGVGTFFNGFHYGVEFAGGRSYTVRFDKEVSREDIEDDLSAALGNEKGTVIKTIGNSRTLDITTAYKIDSTSKATDSVVQAAIMRGLSKHLPANITYEQFDKNYKLASKKVLPTISDDLKRGAVKATIFALIAIFLYILIRFRDWRYSLGTIFALLHDVLVTLIVFSYAKNIVGFPLEIDQHFIAAILTVIGFSMNDTVIVFDRIREDRKLYPSASLAETINRAINETLSRTIMTSLTVFLTLLILFIVGGEVTRGFAFAMLVGVITGIYSSVFVAAPILVDLGGAGKIKDKTPATPPAKNTSGQQTTTAKV